MKFTLHLAHPHEAKFIKNMGFMRFNPPVGPSGDHIPKPFIGREVI